MTNDELVAQFARCKEWNDPEQWRALAAEYAARGYYDNAARYLRFAEAATFATKGLPRGGVIQIDAEVVKINWKGA